MLLSLLLGNVYDDGDDGDGDGEGDDEGDSDGGGEGLVSHRSPVNPVRQVHTKEPDPLKQAPPFRHGEDKQGSDEAEKYRELTSQ